jgi:flagellar motility protein MotE (MotC chaperone)
MNFFKRVNIFSFLLVISVFAFVMRLVDVADYSIKHSAAESATPSQKLEPVAQAAASAAPPAANALAPATATNTTATPTVNEPAPAAASTTPPAAEQPAAPPPSGDQGFSASEIETLQSLAKRRDELDKREQAIGQKEALLKAAGVEVDRKIVELNKLRGQLEDLLNKQKTAEDERINSLVKIYENMKPKDAANIFNTLEMDVLLPVIAKISERKASPILAAMDPEKARQVTIKLAEQKKLPQLPDDSKKGKSPAAPSTNAPAPAKP